MQIAIGIILIVAAVFLVGAVLMQSGKANNRLSGAIAGGAETFFGKTKGSTIDKKLSKATTIVAIVFVVLVLVSYLMQDIDLGSNDAVIADPSVLDTVETGDTVEGGAEAADTTAAVESDAAAE
ncbi:MAG: preprotein translocase subunit SecG [Clostridia bacterium]|nr:preprotein translocase subunit SecG [Clostridia bacterium]